MKYVLIISVFLIRCGTIPQTSSVSSGKLIGEWVLENGSDDINYGKIEFKEDSTALFLSRGDTIYRFKFHVKSDDLYLIDILGKEESYKLISVTDNQLTFSSLREKKEKQVYKRAQ